MYLETKWSIDPNASKITFEVNHITISIVKGLFREFNMQVLTTGNDFLTAKVDFSINVASIDTGDKNRDQYLLGEDFFDVKQHPKIIFISDSFKKSKINEDYELTGNLTIKGITKYIKLTAELFCDQIKKEEAENDKACFLIKGMMNRKNWSLDWSTANLHGLLVSEGIAINCEVHLVKEMQTKETIEKDLENAVPVEYIV